VAEVESVDLSPALQAELNRLCAELDHLDHFQLLGVEPSAERGAIKKAYYDRIAAYHPDSYFGKNLGSFKRKLELVFQRFTEAHDTLSRQQPRAEYEAYLKARRLTQAAEVAADSNPSLDELERLLQAAEALRHEPLRQSEPVARASTAPEPSPLSQATRRSSSARVQSPVIDPRVRRDALARKLGRVPRRRRLSKPQPRPCRCRSTRVKSSSGPRSASANCTPSAAKLSTADVVTTTCGWRVKRSTPVMRGAR
jgi:curved DNA-binding protein CbpA